MKWFSCFRQCEWCHCHFRWWQQPREGTLAGSNQQSDGLPLASPSPPLPQSTLPPIHQLTLPPAHQPTPLPHISLPSLLHISLPSLPHISLTSPSQIGLLSLPHISLPSLPPVNRSIHYLIKYAYFRRSSHGNTRPNMNFECVFGLWLQLSFFSDLHMHCLAVPPQWNRRCICPYNIVEVIIGVYTHLGKFHMCHLVLINHGAKSRPYNSPSQGCA